MLLLHNPNLGHIVSYDIRNLRPSRLDSDNGPLMVVDMNYPEFKSQLWNKQGPWRDSADGGHAGQRLPKDFYPNDTVQYDLDRSAGDTYFRGGIHNIKFWPAGYSEAAGKSSFVTVHYGPPYYFVRRYVGYGASPTTGFQLQQEASQITSWQVNNPRGDLSEFHRYYSGHNFIGDSQSWDYSEANLFRNDLYYGAFFKSYPYSAVNNLVDVEFPHNQLIWTLESRDDVAGDTHCGTLRRYNTSSSYWHNWSSTASFTSPATTIAIDSDFLNVAAGDDWYIGPSSGNFVASAVKIRIQRPESVAIPSTQQSRKVLMHVRGIIPRHDRGYNYKSWYDWDHHDSIGSNYVGYRSDWIISATLTDAADANITADSSAYHFNIAQHIGYQGSNYSPTKQRYYTDIQAFDISNDGKILTVAVDDFAGGDAILNFTLDTPWDLRTVQPWDWYDSAAAASGRAGTDTLSGFGISKSVGTAINVPRREFYTNADSAMTYRLYNIADVKGMTGVVGSGTSYLGDSGDFTHWTINKAATYERGIGNGINAIQWNDRGTLLYVVGQDGAVVQYETGILRDSAFAKDLYYTDDSTGPGGKITWYGRK